MAACPDVGGHPLRAGAGSVLGRDRERCETLASHEHFSGPTVDPGRLGRANCGSTVGLAMDGPTSTAGPG